MTEFPVRLHARPTVLRKVIALALLGCLILHAPPLHASGGVYDVKDFGAKGDGNVVDTEAINRAISAAAHAGGGTIHFPPGTYLSYSLHLASNITLYLASGCILVAAEPTEDLTRGYDPVEPNSNADQYQDFGHSHWHNSLIWGEKLENVSILGPGKIFGKGLSRRLTRRDLLPEERRLPEAQRPNISLPKRLEAKSETTVPKPFGYPDKDDELPDGVGNKTIALKQCRNVLLRDFTIFHGGHFAILASGVDGMTIDNLKIDTARDGIDIDCCKDIRITNCTINSPYDDAICLKSSYALGFLRTTSNVTITNCQVSGFDEGTLLDGSRQRTKDLVRGGPTGRIKLGTESAGGFAGITISNCTFEYCRGLAFESVDGGVLEDICVSNIAMRDIVNAPLFLRLGSRLRCPDTPGIGALRRFKLSNVVASNVTDQQGIIIDGVEGFPVEDVELSHLTIQFAGGGSVKDGERTVPSNPSDYPDPSRYGKSPASSLFARYVNRLELDHVTFRFRQEERRPSLVLQNVAGVHLDHVEADRPVGVPFVSTEEVENLIIRDCTGVSDTKPPGKTTPSPF